MIEKGEDPNSGRRSRSTLNESKINNEVLNPIKVKVIKTNKEIHK